MPPLDSRVLFDDLGIHLSTFEEQWADMVSQITRYLPEWDAVAYELADSLTTYFGRSFVGGDDGVLEDTLLSFVWKDIDVDHPSEPHESFELAEIQGTSADAYELSSKAPGGGRYIFARGLSTSAEAEDILVKLRGFRSGFPKYDEFVIRVARLNKQYVNLEQSRQTIVQLIADTVSIVMFPQECSLLGLRVH